MITFNGATKLIVLSATTALDVQDLWSRWVDWVATDDNSKFLPAFRSVGGDTIDSVAGTYIPVYTFMLNGWKIRPQESSHTLRVHNGILLTDDSSDPFVNTVGSFVVRINYQQPVQAIAVDMGGGGGGGATAAQVVDELFARSIEGTLAMPEILRLLVALAGSRSSGGNTNLLKFRDLANNR